MSQPLELLSLSPCDYPVVKIEGWLVLVLVSRAGEAPLHCTVPGLAIRLIAPQGATPSLLCILRNVQNYFF